LSTQHRHPDTEPALPVVADRGDDPILGNSALDRLASAAHQVVIEGSSYRAKLAPKREEAIAA
jgi:hypothetical protein